MPFFFKVFMKKIPYKLLQKKIKEAYEFCANQHFDEAIVIFKEILKDYPSQILALSGLATIYFFRSEFTLGIEVIEKSLQIDPYQPDALNNYSIALRELNQLDKALIQVEKAIKIKPNFLDAIYNRGLIYSSLGDLDGALSEYNRIIKLEPQYINAYLSSSSILIQQKKYIEAITNINKILSININHQEAYYNYGIALLGLGEGEEAKKRFDMYISFCGNDVRVLCKVAQLFFESANYEESLNYFNVALMHNSKLTEALNGRGRTYHKLNEFSRALKDFDEAIELNEHYAEAYNNKALTLLKINVLEEAEKLFKKAIDIDKNYADAYNNLGVLNKNLEESVRYLNEAIKLKSNEISFKFNLALIYLAHKKFQFGWEYYENRSQLIKFKNDYPNEIYSPKILNSNEKLLLLSEQGLGDQILFLSMLSELLSKNSNLDVVIDHRLMPVFERTFPEVNFISNQSSFNINNYKNRLLIGSLGFVFRQEFYDFKKHPYSYLRSDETLKKYLREKIEHESNSNLICGIAWKSKNEYFGDKKSLQLENLLPILSQKNITFINLQYGVTQDEIDSIKSKYNIEIMNINEIDTFNNIDGLFSLIDACDLVITTSNVTAHMAGALGKKTFLMVPYLIGKMWYWHEDDMQSIWYPSITIFRQQTLLDWHDPIYKISELVKSY